MIGQTISHYRILEKLGKGGMGVVYKAQDTFLDRLVALKFLPPTHSPSDEDKARFIHEAKAASSLDHPNICTVHEINETSAGQSFLAMAYYEGKVLSEVIKDGPLKIDEALDIAMQIANGLNAAHEKGIVHRDIKSSNVMETKSGQIKILDFGLAKKAGATLLTKSSATIGTVPYMSPEQARGETVNQRTDIWSLGVLLYEMITGRLPFRSEYNEALVYFILNEDPPPVTSLRSDVPMELERIVQKAMQKVRSERYQRVEELLTDLRVLQKQLEFGVSAGQPSKSTDQKRKRPYLYGGVATIVVLVAMASLFIWRGAKREEKSAIIIPIEKAMAGAEVSWKNSIAVLPFKNISADKEQEFFCDGITEQIITNLSNLRDLKVVARTSVMQFKNTDKTIPQIAQELNVANALEGSVRKSGNRIRITAQLIKADDGFHLWVKDYDRELKDIFAVQDDVSKEIVQALKFNLTNEQTATLTKRYTDDTEAYQLYLKGRYFWDKRTREDNEKAIVSFEKAIRVDPNYALAYAGLADTYLFESPLPRKISVPNARETALRALAIDSTLAEAQTTLAFIKMNYEFDWSRAKKGFERAIELNQNYSVAHQFYGTCLLNQGKTEEGLREAARALELDPLSLAVNWGLGMNLYDARRYDQAIEQLRKTLQMEPNYSLALGTLAQAYLQKGMYSEAISLFQQNALRTNAPNQKADLAYAYAVSGNRGEAGAIITELQKLPGHLDDLSYAIAKVYSGLGEIDEAMAWLQKAYEGRDFGLFFLKVNPAFDGLHSDQRFVALLKKVGLGQ